MLRRLRATPGIRAALLVGAAAALLASFGLHPEPLGAGRAATHRGLASAHVDDAPHVCPACPTHSVAVVAPPARPIATDERGARVSRPVEISALSRLAALDLPGRSPPVFA